MAKLESHFFKHDVTAKDDQKILELRADYGAEGYGLYWMMVETMYTSGGNIDRGAIGGLSLGYGVPKDTLLAIMNRCTELGLLIEIDEGKLTSKRVQEAIGDRRQASINGKKGAEKRWKNKKTDGDPNGVAIGLPCLPHDDPNSKERRGEEKREETKPEVPFEKLLTDNMTNPNVIEAWTRWCAYRKEVRKKLTKSTAEGQIKLLGKLEPQVIIATIENSITNGWQGLFPDKVSVSPAHTLTVVNDDISALL